MLFLGPSVTVQSPDYPAEYPVIYEETWSLNVDVGTVHIRVTAFDLEPNIDCAQFDWAKVFTITVSSLVSANYQLCTICFFDPYLISTR